MLLVCLSRIVPFSLNFNPERDPLPTRLAEASRGHKYSEFRFLGHIFISLLDGERKDFETQVRNEKSYVYNTESLTPALTHIVFQFRNYASEIIAVSQENAGNTFRSIAGLGVTITSHAQAAKKKWPFLTLPHFDARAHAKKALSGVRLLCFAPLVTKKTKAKWERYSTNHARSTFQESIDYQSLEVGDVNSLQLWPHIYQGDLKTFQFEKEEGPGPYLPMWQLATWKPYLLHLYPSDELEDKFITNNALQYTVGVVLIFAFATLVFLIFDYAVQRHQQKVMQRILQQDRIVSDIFPDQLKDRLYSVEEDDSMSCNSSRAIRKSNRLKAVLDPNDFEDLDTFCSAPIADLYLSTTILISNISGFTAWSSQREPPQIIMLLETIYGAFDKIANNYGVYNVETVGDLYVAVCGLPELCNSHASVMAKFARDCMEKMNELTAVLEIVLGPDTADLKIRIGLHSGQVTGGVLRGERSRFQLFGDTVNMATRMESEGLADKIHLSSDTARLLQEEGKEKWMSPRNGKVFVKGKGDMQTYWLETKEETKWKIQQQRLQKRLRKEEKRRLQYRQQDNEEESDTETVTSDSSSWGEFDSVKPEFPTCGMSKTERLVEWNVEILSSLLCQIVACRQDNRLNTMSDMSDNEAKIGKRGYRTRRI